MEHFDLCKSVTVHGSMFDGFSDWSLYHCPRVANREFQSLWLMGHLRWREHGFVDQLDRDPWTTDPDAPPRGRCFLLMTSLNWRLHRRDSNRLQCQITCDFGGTNLNLPMHGPAFSSDEAGDGSTGCTSTSAEISAGNTASFDFDYFRDYIASPVICALYFVIRVFLTIELFVMVCITPWDEFCYKAPILVGKGLLWLLCVKAIFVYANPDPPTHHGSAFSSDEAGDGPTDFTSTSTEISAGNTASYDFNDGVMTGMLIVMFARAGFTVCNYMFQHCLVCGATFAVAIYMFFWE